MDAEPPTRVWELPGVKGSLWAVWEPRNPFFIKKKNETVVFWVFKQPTHKLTFGHETFVARDGGGSMPSVKITECRSDLICPKYQIAQVDPK